MPPFRVCSIYDSFVERIYVPMCISKFYVFRIFKVYVRLYDICLSERFHFLEQLMRSLDSEELHSY